FNSPYGACQTCDGLGTNLEVDVDLVIPDWDKSLKKHAIDAWKPISSQYYPQLLKSVCDHYGIDMSIPVKDLPKENMDKVLYGSGKEKIRFYYVNDFVIIRDFLVQFEGVLNIISRRYRETTSDFIREKLGSYMAEKKCPTCHGYRLKKEALSVLLNGK